MQAPYYAKFAAAYGYSPVPQPTPYPASWTGLNIVATWAPDVPACESPWWRIISVVYLVLTLGVIGRLVCVWRARARAERAAAADAMATTKEPLLGAVG